MVNLRKNGLHLRALEPSDIQFLYDLENNSAYWEISNTVVPFAKHVLESYIENAHRDIYDVRQLRLVICLEDETVLGCVDLFDFEPKHKRAGVGIVISAPENQKKGYATLALSLLSEYAFNILGLHQLYANVLLDNENSLHLFKKSGFVSIGVKKDWCWTPEGYKDEVVLQKIKK